MLLPDTPPTNRPSKFKYYMVFQLIMSAFLSVLILLNISVIHSRVVPLTQLLLAAVIFTEM